MTHMSEMDLIRRVPFVEKKAGLTQVQRHREKEKRDRGREGSRRFEKELENRQVDKRIDITV
jgi:hypothetical protein